MASPSERVAASPSERAAASRKGRAAPARSGRAEKSAERRAAILAAALDEFSARGYAAARLDDVARRAGVAKGTIYLHFRDKEALFQDLVRSMVSPLVSVLETLPTVDLPFRVVVDRIVEMFVKEVYGTRRKDVLRLILTEGPRFPELAEFYYREVVSRILAAVRALVARAIARGEITGDTFERYPQLLIAPGIVGIFWNGLFERHEPLDVGALMRAHVDLLLGPGRAA